MGLPFDGRVDGERHDDETILTFAVVFQNQDSLSSLQSIAQQAVTSAGLDARVTSPAQRTDPSSECCVE